MLTAAAAAVVTPVAMDIQADTAVATQVVMAVDGHREAVATLADMVCSFNDLSVIHACAAQNYSIKDN